MTELSSREPLLEIDLCLRPPRDIRSYFLFMIFLMPLVLLNLNFGLGILFLFVVLLLINKLIKKKKKQKIICYEDGVYFPHKKYWQQEVGSEALYSDILHFSLSKGTSKENALFAIMNVGYKDSEGDYTSFQLYESYIKTEDMFKLKDLIIEKSKLKGFTNNFPIDVKSSNITFSQCFEK